MRTLRNDFTLAVATAAALAVPLIATAVAAPDTPAATKPAPPAALVGKTVLLAERTQTTGCTRGALPDRDCSPAAYYSKLTKAVICAHGFTTKKIRYVPTSEKHAVEIEYGLEPKSYGKSLEIDHIISLELGGSNDIANLYPQPGTGTWNYRVKDKLENRLHKYVCAGEITLARARREIASNWKTLYTNIYGGLPSPP